MPRAGKCGASHAGGAARCLSGSAGSRSARARSRCSNLRLRRDGEIFALRTAEGMVVKRAKKSADGRWQSASDHAALESVAFSEDAVILGRAVWTARVLV